MLKQILRVSLILSACCYAVPALAELAEPAQTRPFALLSLDKKALLKGQLDYPSTPPSGPFPLVVLVPGTGLFDRDVHFGKPGDPRSLLFKQLSAQLNQRGVATLRFDYRGVCHINALPPCKSCSTPAESRDFIIKTCYDHELRAGVTPANQRTDLHQIYSWGTTQPQIDPQRVVVLAHSEGTVHTAWLIKEQQIRPKGVALIGGPFESLANVIKWQMVGRIQAQIMSADANADGSVSREELTLAHPKNPLLAMYPLEALLPPEGSGLTLENTSESFNTVYHMYQSETLKMADSEPYPSQGLAQASMAWWKMFFTDSPPIAEWFHSQRIPVINHLGDNDSQISLAQQEEALQHLPAGHQLQVIRHPGRGHSLGSDTLLAPMHPDSEKLLLDSVLELLK